jgi:hypothetical protein
MGAGYHLPSLCAFGMNRLRGSLARVLVLESLFRGCASASPCRLLAAVGLEPPQQMEGIDDPLLLTLSDEQLSEVFSEVLRYYDKDLSGR